MEQAMHSKPKTRSAERTLEEMKEIQVMIQNYVAGWETQKMRWSFYLKDYKKSDNY